jgi:hypothetical protein
MKVTSRRTQPQIKPTFKVHEALPQLNIEAELARPTSAHSYKTTSRGIHPGPVDRELNPAEGLRHETVRADCDTIAARPRRAGRRGRTG